MEASDEGACMGYFRVCLLVRKLAVRGSFLFGCNKRVESSFTRLELVYSKLGEIKVW